jgi:uncharacterized membrane protein
MPAGRATQAVTWTANGSVTALSLQLGATGCSAVSINDHGQIVGISYASSDANTLVSPDVNALGWLLQHAFGINNLGRNRRLPADADEHARGTCIGHDHAGVGWVGVVGTSAQDAELMDMGRPVRPPLVPGAPSPSSIEG